MKEIGLVALAFVAFFMADKTYDEKDPGIIPVALLIVSFAAIAKAAWMLIF